MYERRFELSINCGYCGHHNRLTIATVSLPDFHLLNCALCCGTLGTVASVDSGQLSSETAAPEFRRAG